MADILSNDDIRETLKHLGLWEKSGGIYSISQAGFNKLDDGSGNKYMVFLVQEKPNKVGHWVALLNKGGKIIYKDPFGGLPPKPVVRVFPDLWIDDSVYQHLNENNCGIYTIKFIRDHLAN